MNETMGQIIRRLRKNAELTQEELAEQLGVTCQAVSRWENDTGMPDISQIVPLANVFDVPTDVLFGRTGQKADAEIAEFEARMIEDDHNPPAFADDKEWFRWRLDRTDAYRKMSELHQNNVLLLRRAMEEGVFAVAEYTEGSEDYTSVLPPDGYRALLEECVKWGERIVRLSAEAQDTTGFYDAKRAQIGAYIRLGKTEKALEIARTFPEQPENNCYAQQAEIARLTGDREGEIIARARMISRLLETLSCEAGMLGQAYSDENRYAEARECFGFARKLETAVYGEESWTPPFIPDQTMEYPAAAGCLIREGRKEEAVGMLEEFCDYVIRRTEAWNTRLNEPSASALLRPIPWNYNDKVKQNAKETLTFWLGLKTFETLRGNPRFEALMKRIEELPED